MALTTDLIGVHTALGAFVAGVIIGQSPILTEHIRSELSGLVLAFFSPVFFAVAGLSVDLTTLRDPASLLFTLAIIVVATAGKFLGAFLGGELGGLTLRESLALATGLNARGSTEVIIASIGLAMGALSNQLYTMIVAMAVLTTMAMPPSLRWVMSRVPLRKEEEQRLEKEEAEEFERVPKMERSLVYVDESANGRSAALLAGLFAGCRRIVTTVMEKNAPAGGDTALASAAARVEATADRVGARRSKENPDAPQTSKGELVHAKAIEAEVAVEKEAAKGYSIAIVGIERPIPATGRHFEQPVQALVEAFDGPVAVLVNGGGLLKDRGLNVLVASGGSSEARLAVELAVALASASGGALTVLHVVDPQDAELLRSRAGNLGRSVLVDARLLGKRNGVSVKAITAVNSRPEKEIIRCVRAGTFDLLVLGTGLRKAETKFIGPRTASLLADLRAPVLLVAS
jgi:nucleotide-binding universal stress UspA family protein